MPADRIPADLDGAHQRFTTRTTTDPAALHAEIARPRAAAERSSAGPGYWSLATPTA